MVKILNVAEKNDAAKSISGIMSRGTFRKREGFSKYNKIYEFSFDNFLNRSNDKVTMIMTSVSGHLLNFSFSGQYTNWQAVNPVLLFEAPLDKVCLENCLDIRRTLEKEIKLCSYLIIWTDCDREGENIGMEIVKVCTEVKPNIKVLRAKFSEITTNAVLRAVKNLVSPDLNVSEAVDVRQELDLRIGAAFTRFQTLRLQKLFPDLLFKKTISYGSCQFPTLGFVVERFKQVQSFISEPFWKLEVKCASENGDIAFNWKRNRLFDYHVCKVIYEHCIERPELRITNLKSKPKSKWRPQALDTVELEKQSSKKLKINAKETMTIAEKLYMKGFISYPRTETNQFPKDFDLKSLISKQLQDERWSSFAQKILQKGPKPRNGNKSDKAHPPIHPLKPGSNFTGNEAKVYEFVVRHFLACLSDDAKGFETVVEAEIAGEEFHLSGLLITEKNYLEVYPYEKWSDKVIPQFDQNQVITPKSIELLQSSTSPPSLLTEADLISLMEKHGIGTDATHAEHIETVKTRLYVGVNNEGRFVPGELGMGLVEGYDSMGFEMSKPYLRSDLEKDLKLICEGRRNKDLVLSEQINKYKNVFVQAVGQANKIDEALSQYFGAPQESAGVPSTSTPYCKCPRCGSDMIVKRKKDNSNFFISCLGFPTCTCVIWMGPSVSGVEVLEEKCTQCTPASLIKNSSSSSSSQSQSNSQNLKKLKITLKDSSSSSFGKSIVSCLGCNEDLNNFLDIKLNINLSSTNSNDHTNNFNNNNNNNHHQNTINNNNNTNRRLSLSSHSIENDSGFLSGNSNNFRGSQQTIGENNQFVCSCNKEARLLTVKKEGPNKGRQFYCCSQPRETRCSFFVWADSENQSLNESNHPHSSQVHLSGSSNFDLQPSSDSLLCFCGIAAKEKIVQKEGANKGRRFWGCSKGLTQGACNFFKWFDQDDSMKTNNFKNKKTAVKKTSDPHKATRARRCGVCGEEGHTKKTCPHR